MWILHVFFEKIYVYKLKCDPLPFRTRYGPWLSAWPAVQWRWCTWLPPAMTWTGSAWCLGPVPGSPMSSSSQERWLTKWPLLSGRWMQSLLIKSLMNYKKIEIIKSFPDNIKFFFMPIWFLRILVIHMPNHFLIILVVFMPIWFLQILVIHIPKLFTKIFSKPLFWTQK